MTVIATAGHVDHGKSSLVRAICGTDPDRLAEEKRRGMTIELGFAHRVLDDGTTLSFVDVPGHVDFVRTMVSGAGAADVALLVVDAGEGWMPQTEEHAAILGLMGVDSGVIAVTKTDRVDGATVDAVVADVLLRLQDSPVRWRAVVPVSVVDGSGIDALLHELRDAVTGPLGGDDGRRARIFVDRVFTVRGAGTVVTGTLDTGTVGPDDVLVVPRTGLQVRVRSVQTHGREVEKGATRTRCAVNLHSVGTHELRRGDALVTPDLWHSTMVFDAALTLISGARPVSHREGYSLHVGTNDQLASVRVVSGDAVHPGSTGTVRVRCAETLALTPGDRFLLRDPGTGTTVGGGTVLDVDPRDRISRARPDGTVESQLRGRGWIGVDEARRLTGADLQPVVGKWYADPGTVDAARQDLERRARDGSLDAALLTEPERLLLAGSGIRVTHGRSSADGDALDRHDYAVTIRSAGVTPPQSRDLDRDTVRRMVQAGILLEHDGYAFHRDVVDGLRSSVTMLLRDHPHGFTVSHLRESLGITRRHAVPLAVCLDKAGITSRRGDIRTAGPRL